MRYLFEIAYKGTNYHGWQRQLNAQTVQQVVEETLSTILREPITILGSGRTDTGVHCQQQFFHIETLLEISSKDLRPINNFLPPDIAIRGIQKMTDDGHARFSALHRKYEYRISKIKSPFQQDLTYYFHRDLNVKTMNEAATLLRGKKDFESFSRVKTEVNNFFCHITEAHWEESDTTLTFHIRANRFLRGMVRAIVGTLLDVGLGKITPDEVESIIIAKNRKKAGAAAPAHGLFLIEVMYPSEIFIK